MASYGPHGRLLCPWVYLDNNTDQPMGWGTERSTKKSRHEGEASRPLLAWPDLGKTIYTELPTTYSGGGGGGRPGLLHPVSAQCRVSSAPTYIVWFHGEVTAGGPK